jgi:hypothetical protein
MVPPRKANSVKHKGFFVKLCSVLSSTLYARRQAAQVDLSFHRQAVTNRLKPVTTALSLSRFARVFERASRVRLELLVGLLLQYLDEVLLQPRSHLSLARIRGRARAGRPRYTRHAVMGSIAQYAFRVRFCLPDAAGECVFL